VGSNGETTSRKASKKLALRCQCLLSMVISELKNSGRWGVCTASLALRT